jgi:hypothetical protein
VKWRLYLCIVQSSLPVGCDYCDYHNFSCFGDYRCFFVILAKYFIPAIIVIMVVILLFKYPGLSHIWEIDSFCCSAVWGFTCEKSLPPSLSSKLRDIAVLGCQLSHSSSKCARLKKNPVCQCCLLSLKCVTCVVSVG